MSIDPEVKGRAQDTAQEANQQARQVGQTAKEEAANVAEQAKEQGRNLVDEARSQLDEQSRGQRDRLVSLLQGVGGDLDKMSSNAPEGIARDLTQQLGRRVQEFGGRLDGREPSDLLEEVRRFARRRPGTFLLGAAIAGVAVGRFARGAKQAQDRRTDVTPAVPSQRVTADTGVGDVTTTPPTTAPLVEPPVPEAAGVEQTVDEPTTTPPPTTAGPAEGLPPGSPGSTGLPGSER